VEEDIYGTLRGLDETVLLLNQLGDGFAEANHARLAALYFQQSRLAEQRAALIRQAAMLPGAHVEQEPLPQKEEED
jgi:two-component system chemotaxis response regulator CheB